VTAMHLGSSPQQSWGKPDGGDSAGLTDGSRVAVIGGGPAGSMFSYFLLRMAGNIGVELGVDIYEPRYFKHKGPAGCNHCGGVVSESLVQRLATEGINLESSVIQRGIDSYTLHMDVGTVRIDAPLHEKRIAAVYRGNGPRYSEVADIDSFDSYLQELAMGQGARMVRQLVTDLQRNEHSMQVGCADGHTSNYDLVVVATGVNSRFLEIVQACISNIRPPETAKTFICEFSLGDTTIRKHLGSSMHVFFMDLPHLEFAALIPKGDYATLCLLGDHIDEELVQTFLSASEVRQCFPDALVPPHVCHCFPRMNSATARPTFGNRLVMIGDSGTTRLLKDGIGGAYRTAKAAARTVLFHGITAADFQKFYWPICRKLDFDNDIGKGLFFVSGLIQRARFARRAVLRMTANEQAKTRGRRRMSEILWDLFTGSASYREVFLNTLHPAYIGALLWNLVVSNWPLSRHQMVSHADDQA
jgi:flavin-dependent dehydrogenase